MSLYNQITWNHRTIEVGRDLFRSSSPTPLLRQGQLKQITQDHIQSGYECLHGWRLNILSGQPVPVFELSHCKIVFFPVFKLYFMPF